MNEKGQDLANKIIENIGKVIVGKDKTVKLLLTALLADGHVLLEDVPGTGKTKLAKTLSKSIGASFSRIQFTPDLLPGDITGINIYDRQSNQFLLKKGPVFTNILLADEINRATPRTQSGLLEAMEERQVTIDGVSYTPGHPFFVIATQNPVESAGVFPLPEAQMDRFMMKLSMGMPTAEEELAILDRYMTKEPLQELEPVMTLEELVKTREEINELYVHPCVREYMVQIIDATRKAEGVIMGVSPRGSLALLRSVKAYAYLEGRSYVTPDDVKALVIPVLAHRMIVSYGMDSIGNGAEALLERILQTVNVPTEVF